MRQSCWFPSISAARISVVINSPNRTVAGASARNRPSEPRAPAPALLPNCLHWPSFPSLPPMTNDYCQISNDKSLTKLPHSSSFLGGLPVTLVSQWLSLLESV